MAIEDALKRLSPRQRTCLGMVATHISPKQIARDLGISEHTVRSYLAEAIEILDASDLRHAARLFLENSQEPPLFLGREIHRVASDTPPEPNIEPESEIKAVSSTTKLNDKSRFHFLRGERKANDLSQLQRVIWIFIAAFYCIMLLATSSFAIEMITKIAILSHY